MRHGNWRQERFDPPPARGRISNEPSAKTKDKIMKKGTRVCWTLKSGLAGGQGTVITDEVDGAVQVKVESRWRNDGDTGQLSSWIEEMHYVISCTVTWLSVLPT